MDVNLGFDNNLGSQGGARVCLRHGEDNLFASAPKCYGFANDADDSQKEGDPHPRDATIVQQSPAGGGQVPRLVWHHQRHQPHSQGYCLSQCLASAFLKFNIVVHILQT